ncbi:MAG: M15 family metallopeptidase [Candidatus Woesearchaeota archaeon]
MIRLTKNKKAVHIFMFLLLVITMISCFTLLVVIKNLSDDNRDVGKAAAIVMEAAQTGEEVLNYIDFAAKYAVRQTEYDLASKGGMKESECGDYQGVAFWYMDSKLCLPKAYKEDFKEILNNKLRTYLKVDSDLEGPLQSIADIYTFKILPERILGLPMRDVLIEGTLVEVEKAIYKPKILPEYINPSDDAACLMERYGSVAHKTVKLKSVDLGGIKHTVNAKMADALTNVAEEIKATDYEITNWHSCRTNNEQGPKCGDLHQACLAIDINVRENPHCPKNGKHGSWWKRKPSPYEIQRCLDRKVVTDIPVKVIQIFEANGFYWGGRFKNSQGNTPDAMHFQFVTECCSARPSKEPLEDVFIRTDYSITPDEIFAQYPKWSKQEKNS